MCVGVDSLWSKCSTKICVNADFAQRQTSKLDAHFMQGNDYCYSEAVTHTILFLEPIVPLQKHMLSVHEK